MQNFAYISGKHPWLVEGRMVKTVEGTDIHLKLSP